MKNFSKKPSKAQLKKRQAESKEQEAASYGGFLFKPRRYGLTGTFSRIFDPNKKYYCNTCQKNFNGGLIQTVMCDGHDIVEIEDTDFEQVNLLNP